MKAHVKILIIEDCLEDVQIYQKLLQKSFFFDYELKHVLTVSEALNAMECHCFDCILLDHFLPGTNGIELLEIISEQELRIPIILLTGSNDVKLDLAAMQKGAIDFIEKSDLTSKLLERSIRYAIECQKHINHILDINREREEIFCKICAKLKNPIKAIISYCDLFFNRTDIAPYGPHIYDLIKYMHQYSKEQLNSISEIIKENFVSHKNPVLNCQEVDLVPLLERLKQGKRVVFRCDSPEGLLISADKLKITNVLRIIIREALKFAKNDLLEIELNKKDDLINIMFIFKDIKLKEGDFDKLFIPDNKYKASNGSVGGDDITHGIDLSYAKNLLELHLGKIEFRKYKVDGMGWLISLPSLVNHESNLSVVR